MRIALPVVLLLFGASSAHGQTQTSGSVEPRAEPTVPAQAPVQPLPTAAPAPALQEELVTPRGSARVEATTAAEQAQPAEKKRSRVVWFLVGAVVVLGILVAATI